MRALPWIRAFTLLLCALPRVARAEVPPSATAPDSLAHVTYLSGDLVYLDAGGKDGIETGQVLQVERDGVLVGTLRVEHVASHRASCSLAGGAMPQLGDIVRYNPAAAPPRGDTLASVRPASSPRKPGGSGGLRALGLRGRVGLRYFSTLDQTGFGSDYSQPSLDVQLAGRDIAGGPLSLLVDARARRTYRTHVDGSRESDGRTRVYRLNVSYRREGSPLRVSVGRQVSSELASVSLFDGVLGEVEGATFAAGGFAGTQPDPESYGLSTRIFETGAYARMQNGPGAGLRWSMASGAIRSMMGGVKNRDYVFLNGRIMSSRAFGMVSQEIDIDEWRRVEADRQLFSPTSTFATFRWRALPALSLDAGYDNRRSVRLYQDRETPETEFDFSYRQGIRGGVTLQWANRYTLGMGAQTRGGGSGGTSDSFTLTTRLARLTLLAVDMGSRHTRFTTPIAAGWLHSANLGFPVGALRRLQLEGGRRQETRSVGEPADVVTTWFGLDADVGLGVGWYLMLSGTSTRGDLEKNDQVFTSLTYRF